jgi:hypothetical protein
VVALLGEDLQRGVEDGAALLRLSLGGVLGLRLVGWFPLARHA